MLNLRNIKRICVLGAGTAGWFAALELKRIFDPSVEIMLISAPEIPIVGVGEGGITNFMNALQRLDIPLLDFLQHTGAVHKLGFVYEGWRKGVKDKNDQFYHMFPIVDEERLWLDNGYYPLLSAMANHDIPVSYIVDSIRLREKNISQDALTKMLINEDHIPLDFLIDASGFARVVIGKKFSSQWLSLRAYLPMDTAIPFHLQHQRPNPDLVTRTTAMNAGWVWQIPATYLMVIF